MAYSITTTAGQTLATIADGTVNTTTTSLTLIGKNYAGYGLFLNENYIKLLENFSNGIPPSSALQGQLWYDSGANILKVYSGSIWKPISSSATGSTQPVNPVLGDLWWDTANAQLKVWSGTAWIVVGPAYTTSSGTSGAIVETILDNISNSHTVVRFYISNVTMAILSNDPVFTPLTAIAGFTTIKPGFNLVSASTVANSQYSGIAENSVKLNGLESSAFIRGDQPIDVEYTITAGGGLIVGEDLSINGNVTNTATEIKNLVGNHNMDFYVKSGATDRKALAIAGSTGNVTLSSNLLVTGGIITTAATTGTLFDTSTTVNIGASTGNTIVKNNLQVVGENIITTAATVSFANTTTTSMQIGSAATAITMGAPAGVVTARGDLAVNGGDITTTASTFNLLNSTATTLNIGQAATSLIMGATTGTANIRNATTNIIGNLVVAGSVQTGIIRNTSGTEVFTNGYPKQPGQIIEYLTNWCDGTSITSGVTGEVFTWQDSTLAVDGPNSVTVTYADIIGSSISYVPPSWAKKVIYRFNFLVSFYNTHGIGHGKFFIDGNEVVRARAPLTRYNTEVKVPYEVVVNIGGTTDYAAGRVATWDAPKILKMQAREYNASNQPKFHYSYYWDGAVASQFSMPTLSIIAIA